MSEFNIGDRVRSKKTILGDSYWCTGTIKDIIMIATPTEPDSIKLDSPLYKVELDDPLEEWDEINIAAFKADELIKIENDTEPESKGINGWAIYIGEPGFDFTKGKTYWFDNGICIGDSYILHPIITRDDKGEHVNRIMSKHEPRFYKNFVMLDDVEPPKGDENATRK